MRPRYVCSRDIPGALKCTICTDTFYVPVRLQCGHVFCKQCIEACLKSDYEQRCPLDRSRVNLAVSSETLVTKILFDLKVYCSFLEKGCVWQGEQKWLADHVASCKSKDSVQQSENLEDMYSDFLNDANNEAKLKENLFDKKVLGG